MEVSLTNASGACSNTATKSILVQSVNDAPYVGFTQVLYDGSTNSLPTAAGADGISATSAPWLTYRDSNPVGPTTQTAIPGNTTLTTDRALYAGYSNYTFTPKLGVPVTFTSSLTNSKFPVLDRNAGYVLKIGRAHV